MEALRVTNLSEVLVGSNGSTQQKCSVSLFQLDILLLALSDHNTLCSGDIMIEYCYPECTTSVITSLSIFRKHFPDYRVRDIE